MSKITQDLTKTLYGLAKADLEEAKEEKKMSTRIGMVLQAMKSAMQRAWVYTWNGVPHVYTGKIYEALDPNELKGVIFDVLDRQYANMPPEDMTQIMKIQQVCMQVVQGKLLRIRRDIIVFENCVLCLGDLRDGINSRACKDLTGEEISEYDEKLSKHYLDGESYEKRKTQFAMMKHSPELAQTTMCHFDYDPKAESPLWDRFLDTVLPNKSMQMVLQEFMGCIYIDRTQAKMEQMCILVGGGANGKSVVADVVRSIVGEEAMTCYGLDSILVGAESLRNIAKMNGKRLNYCTEIQAINAGRYGDKLKTLISGEPFECRQMYGSPFTARDIPLMMANCNSLPQLEDTTYGMQRRFIIIRFDVTIERNKQDKQLSQKLNTEMAGIFNWIMDGRQRYIDQQFKFTLCRQIDKAVLAYINSPNNVLEWVNIQEYYANPVDVVQQEAWEARMSSLYDEYRRWCVGCNQTPMSKLKFSMELRGAGFKTGRNLKGVYVKLWGERAFAAQTRNKALEQEKKLKEAGALAEGQEIRKGVILDVGDKTMAKNAHISVSQLGTYRRYGWLDGCFVMEKRTPKQEGRRTPQARLMRVYDHKRVLKRLEAGGAYDEKRPFLELPERRRDEIQRAKAFNMEMLKMKQPFRKLTGDLGKQALTKNMVVVDPDWEYTPDNAEAMGSSIVAMKVREMQDTDLVVTEDGKMFQPSSKRRKTIAEAVEAELRSPDPLERMANSGELVDEATGEVLEVEWSSDDVIK